MRLSPRSWRNTARVLGLEIRVKRRPRPQSRRAVLESLEARQLMHASSVVVDTSISASGYGETVVFTADVTPADGYDATPTGTVDFVDSSTGTDLGTETLDGNGDATLTTDLLNAGDHTIVATYSGDSNFDSSSASVDQEFDQAAASVQFASSADDVVYGQPVTLTANVAAYGGYAGTPTGSVDFYDETTGEDLGSASLDGSGDASMTLPNLSVGDHTIEVTYSGDGNFLGGSSDSYVDGGNSFVQEIDQASVVVSAETSSSSANYGDYLTFTATVSAAGGSSGTPTGSVDFYDESTEQDLGSIELDGTGTASLSTSNLGVGDQSIEAIYSGDSYFASGNASFDQQVSAPTGISISSPDGTSFAYGQTANLEAFVYSYGGVPTGSVDFYNELTGVDYGSVELDGSGYAGLATGDIGVGDDEIVATYNGEGGFESSNASLEVDVYATSSVVLTSSIPNPSVYGESVTFAAAVSGSYGGVATGTVDFYDETTGEDLGTVALDGNGDANLSTSNLSVEDHTIVATYSGDSNLYGSQDSLTQEVDYGTTTTLSSSTPNPSIYGENVTFTAVVSASNGVSGIPTGSVDFYDETTGQDLGTATLDGNGDASLSVGNLIAEDHSIVATYSGDSNWDESQDSLTQEVEYAPTTILASGEPDPSAYGQPLTLTAVVSNSYGGVPTGSVDFYDETTSTDLGTYSLDDTGMASFSTSGLPVGDQAIVASYSGDSNYYSSSATTDSMVYSIGPSISAERPNRR